VRDGWIGERRGEGKGGVTVYEAYEIKKKSKITLSFTSPEKVFFYIYEIFTSPEKENALNSTTYTPLIFLVAHPRELKPHPPLRHPSTKPSLPIPPPTHPPTHSSAHPSAHPLKLRSKKHIKILCYHNDIINLFSSCV
jgi:hypothetical protein